VGGVLMLAGTIISQLEPTKPNLKASNAS
jgi:hypothetical protein